MRPRVLVNLAPSLDGKLAPARRSDGPFLMSRHAEDPARLLALRARVDAVIIGAANLREDDPDLLPGRLRVVVTRSGEGISTDAKMFAASSGGEAIVAHTSSMPESRRAALRPRATLVDLGAGDVAPLSLLGWLARERACREVVCEGGGGLVASFLAARAVDELRLTIVPRVLGGVGAPGIVGGQGFDADALPDARLASVEQVGDELFLAYAFTW